jgi:replicative DNA helicase
MDKQLPANIEAERATLGSILLNREAIIAVASWLQPEDFYLEQNAWIYEAMLSCYNARTPPDIRTVSDELRRRGRLEPVGGLASLAALVDSVPTSYHIEYYARIIQRTALLRKLIGAGGKIAALGYDEQDDIEATLDRAESTLFEVSQRRTNQDFVHIGQVIDTYYEQINYLQEHRGEVVGIPTGFRDLDEITGGLQRSDLIILAARPGVGKCLAAWTLIDDPATGERLTIEECVRRRQASVYGVSPQGKLRPALISAWVDSGVKRCFRVTTRTGRTIDATAKHPFLTALGWVPLRNLTRGTAIAVPRALPVFGSEEPWPLALVRLLAYLLSEHGTLGPTPAFASDDPELLADFQATVETHFPSCAVRREGGRALVEPRGRRAEEAHPLVAWLEQQGLAEQPAHSRALPAQGWRWTRRFLAEFLRTLMSCDGAAHTVGGRPRIDLSLSSQRLAADIQHAWVRFGLVARLYQTPAGTWRVELGHPASIARYQAEIGWSGVRRASLSMVGWTFTAPGLGRPLAPARPRTLARDAGALPLLTQAAQAGRLPGARPARPNPPALEHPGLRPIVSPDLYWDEIVSIEDIGEHQVYDLSVPDGANFIAQDICAHNTSFAMSLGYNVALQYQNTVGVFSLEMSREQLVQRLLAMETKIDTNKLRTGQMRDSDLESVMTAMGRLSSIPIYIEDTAGQTVMDIRSKARRLQSQVGVDLLIIDYLQLLQGSRRSDNRVQEVSEISRGLKGLARELNVPIIALSQLSRAVEGRTSHVPMLSDLRESGSIEQDADIVMFIYREELYDKETEKKGIAELHIAKHRNGPVGVIPMRFDPGTTRFNDLSYRTPDGY